MTVFRETSELPHGAEEVYRWHCAPGAFSRLAPPWRTIELQRHDGIDDGDRIVFRLKNGPVSLTWDGVHEEHIPGRQFVDVMERGPFAAWRHVHRFAGDAPDASTLDDEITYRLPLGPLGSLVAGRFIHRDLQAMFRFRHRRTRADIDRHARFAPQGSQRIGITGASGLVGQQLRGFLAMGGHDVFGIGRRVRQEGDVVWAPSRGEIDAASLEGVDAVVHLAGEPVASRWTPEKKRRIRDSRVDGTRLIAETLAGLERKPRVLVCASAIGFYGDRGDEELTESSAAGTGFLPETCLAWEQAADAAREAGIRVVHVRVGIVLSALGAALKEMLLPFQLGVGGPMGSGAQWISWIALDDLVGLLHHAVMDDGMVGPVNGTAPEPVRQRDFARVLGRVLRRPAILPAPALAVRALMGEMGQALLLEGARVLPRAAEERGYAFHIRDVEDAMRFELGKLR